MHTPGPWWVSGPHCNNEPYSVGAIDPTHPTVDKKRAIASVYDTWPRNPTNAANARLIAAAPDLLRVVRDVIEVGHKLNASGFDVQRHQDAFVALVDECARVVTQATGVATGVTYEF